MAFATSPGAAEGATSAPVAFIPVPEAAAVPMPPAMPSCDLAGLLRAHRSKHPRADTRTIRRAYRVADRAHEGQKRKSGEPYITHPLAVAQILVELGMDTTT
ncbi:MAG: HD domain-containing protein, partial [Terriglobales bacterium]